MDTLKLVDGYAFSSPSAPKELCAIEDATEETVLTLASAHALVLLEDGVVGDPMEKTTLEALKWKLNKGDLVARAPAENTENGMSALAKTSPQIAIKRRYQFSSALKRMSTVSLVAHPQSSNRRTFAAVKGAPETLKSMYVQVPDNYEATYKWFAQRGSRVLALGYKWLDAVKSEQVSRSHDVP